MKTILGLAAALTVVGACVAQAPANNACGGAIAVLAGVNPTPPNGASGSVYTNVGATDSSNPPWAVACGVTPHKDVWFTYTAAVTGPVSVSTCTPPGFAAGTLADTVLAIYNASACPGGGADVGCNDDACGNRSTATFDAFDGNQYLIRVGSFSTTLSGTFYLTITEPTANPRDLCGSMPITTGVVDTFSGSTVNTNGYGCPAFAATPHSDLWYAFTATQTCEVLITLIVNGPPASYDLAVYTGVCPTLLNPSSLTAVTCGSTQASFPAAAGVTYRFRAGIIAPAPLADLFFVMTVACTVAPPNDSCASAFVINGGTLPVLPTQTAYFDNRGALDSAGYAAACAPLHNDVFFLYQASTSGLVEINTQTPSGQTPGTLLNTALAVYADCSATVPIACNDNGGGFFTLLSRLTFTATQGSTYVIRVGSVGLFDEGTFWLSVIPQFALAMTSPSGPGSLQINLSNGGATNGYFTALTVAAGAYPSGPFFGIDLTFTELMLELAAAAPPFLGALDGSGAAQYGPATGLPALTLYGVSIEFDAVGNISGVSPPTAHAIP